MNNTFALENISNPVMCSPWESRAPKGGNFTEAWRRHRAPFYHKRKDVAYHNIQLQQEMLSNSYQRYLSPNLFEDLKVLNRNTLMLGFPKLPPRQIDAALALCGYDLSETLNLLLLRERILIKKKEQARQRNGIVRYIPTKDPDVEIVEVCSSNEEASGDEDSQTDCNNVIPKTVESVNLRSSPQPSTSGISDCWNRLEVYDFNDKNVYNLRQRNHTSFQKVGIVLRKNGNGLTVDLL